MKSCVIVMWIISLSVAFGHILKQRIYMLISEDAYCSGSVLRETTASSDSLCVLKCSSDAQCVAYSRRGSQCVLHDGFCSSSDLLPEAGARNTRVNWECFGSSCYYMPTLQRAVRKAEADAICDTMGAHVLALETKEENDLIIQLVYHSSAAYFPVRGLHHPGIWLDLIEDVTWRHSGEAVNFTNWGINEPNGSEEHVSLLKKIGVWSDVDDSSSRVYAFLCEK